MEKTPQEIAAAVLAYCHEVCPPSTKVPVTIGHVTLEWIDYGNTMNSGLRLYGVDDWMSIDESMGEYVASHAYRLLGLDKRDALEAEKEKSKRWESRAWKILEIVRRRENEQRPKTAAVLRTLREVSEKNERLVEAAIPVITTMVAVSQEGMPYEQHVDAVVALSKVLESIHEGKSFEDD